MLVMLVLMLFLLVLFTDLPSIGLCPDDATSPSLASGELFPEDVSSLEEAVGGLDTPITRTDADFET